MVRSPPHPYDSWEECVLKSFPTFLLRSGSLEGAAVEQIGQTERALLQLTLPNGRILFGKRIELGERQREVQLQRVYMETLASIMMNSQEQVTAPHFYGLYLPDMAPNFPVCYLFWEMLTGAMDLRDCLMEHYQTIKGEVALVPLVRNIFRTVVQQVAVVHAAGLVHRDIKSDNIMVRGRDVFLLDFGMAEWAGEAFDYLYDMGLGTVHYTPPECLVPGPLWESQMGEERWREAQPQLPAALPGSTIEPSQDVFALGVLLFEMLQPQGVTPFESEMEEDRDPIADRRRARIGMHLPQLPREPLYQDGCFIRAVPWAYDLFSKLTHPVPGERPSAQDILNHPFFRSHRSEGDEVDWNFYQLAGIARVFYPEHNPHPLTAEACRADSDDSLD